ncbi:unnamed protein product [Soboliphyme baturini]|uniref:DUF4371 domain-containing protein n=1 Tax=Soboliphyme baturini TaxID=241478 RepID=A0A183IBY1_9BILA|nr:unnamed protein product [Soboliphyme baturini]
MVEIFKRKVKDLTASCYNCIQEWQSSVKANVSLLEQIGSRRLTLLADQESGSDAALDQQLTELCGKLVAVVDLFEHRCRRIEKIHADLVALQNYAAATNLDADLLLGCCQFSYLITLLEDLHKSCVKELQCKRAVAQEIAFSPSKDFVTMCIAAWIHQPCLETDLLCRTSYAVFLCSDRL